MESDLPFDFNSIREEEFDRFVDYIVLDQPPDPNNPNRAESSLPRNLKLKKIGRKVFNGGKKRFRITNGVLTVLFNFLTRRLVSKVPYTFHWAQDLVLWWAKFALKNMRQTEKENTSGG